MLNVKVRFVAQELAPGLENGVYEVPEGSTIRELLAICEEKNDVEIPAQNFKLMLFMLDGKNAVMDAAITENSTLHVCRIIIGG